jgi:hypothetical protein
MELLQGNASDILRDYIEGKYLILGNHFTEEAYIYSKDEDTFFLIPEDVEYYLSILVNY